jgi:hypothetical protein
VNYSDQTFFKFLRYFVIKVEISFKNIFKNLKKEVISRQKIIWSKTDIAGP